MLAIPLKRKEISQDVKKFSIDHRKVRNLKWLREVRNEKLFQLLN